MNVYELSSLPYDDYKKIAMAEYEKNFDKPHFTYEGNHHFEWPADEDIEWSVYKPFTHNWDLTPEPSSIAAKEESILNQQQLTPDHPYAQMVQEYFGLRWNFTNFNKLEVGRLMATHIDRHRRLVFDFMTKEEAQSVMPHEKKRYVCFRDDQKCGQMFQCGEQFITWKAGDIFSFPWYMPHATANASDADRYMLSVIGY